MTLFFATLLTGLAMAVFGAPFLIGSSSATAALRAFPRSVGATYVFFGGAAVWFLWNIWHLSSADFGDYRTLLTIGFAAVAVLAFKCVPDFLAVRGVAALVLLAASPLLDSAYMEFDHPQMRLLVGVVYVAISLAIWMGVQPWRVRDFIGWLTLRPGRVRMAGGLIVAYGVVLCVAAFTY